jgi:hypothetical protein
MPLLVTTTTSTVDGSGSPGALLHAGQLLLGEITLGAVDDYGVEWILERLDGWDTPPTTGAVEQRVADHGGWLSAAHYAPRVIEIRGSLIADTWDAASRALDRLASAVPLSSLSTLYVAETERVLQAAVRQEGDPLTERSGGWAQFSLSLIAPDPRRYSPEVVTLETGLPSTSGGLSLPLTLPLTVGATVTSSVLTATNAGNMGTRPTLTVRGPTAPGTTITHRGTGQVLTIPDAVPVNRTLVLDTGRKTALLDGTATRRVRGAWFEYAKDDNEIAFASPVYDASARLVSEHRHAWR